MRPVNAERSLSVTPPVPSTGARRSVAVVTGDSGQARGQRFRHRLACVRGAVPCLAVAAMFIGGACDAPHPAATPETGPPRFAGSAACRTCHAPQFDAWRSSHHRLAMQEATSETVLGDFSDVSFEYFGTETRFLERDGSFIVRTAGADGAIEELEVVHTFGVEPLQQYLVEFPGGRLQALPYAWDTRAREAGGQRWFHLHADEYIEPGDELHWTGRNYNWNYMCAECHSTGVALNYDAATRSFDTRYAETSVGCEACHGPGSRHVAQAEAGDFDERYGLAVNLDDSGDAAWLMNPGTGTAERSAPVTGRRQQPESCGHCHARRGTITANYEYGEPLAHTHMPALLDEGLYFADGQIRDEVYVYGSFLQSRMYSAGVTCTDCHDPHSGRLLAGPAPSDVCARCHLPAKFDTAEHTGHAPGDASCVDCHMPDRTYMGIDERRDHSFRVPRPDLGTELGTPVACNDCHEPGVGAGGTLAAAAGRPHYARGLAAGREGYANATLAALATDAGFPAIARATALTLLSAPARREDVAAVREGLADADPLLRIAALRALRQLPGEVQVDGGVPLLDDPVRGVRIEAARTLAGFRDLLPADANRAFARAADEYRAAFESTANRPESLTALGDFDFASGRVAAAARYYERALGLDPSYVPARLNLADALRQQGDEARAGEVLRAGIDRAADDAALRHAFGLHLVRAGRPEEGLDELRRAAELDPDSARIAYVLGVALDSLGRSDEAVAQLEAARAGFPGDYDIAWALATMHRDRGELDAARQIVDELARRFPDDPNVRALAGQLP